MPVFFDNDQTKIDSVNEYFDIEAYKVADSVYDPLTRRVLSPNQNINHSKFRNNSYLHIERVVEENDLYDDNSGIQQGATPQNSPKTYDKIFHDIKPYDYAIFDWDRTLTMHEGIRLYRDVDTFSKYYDAYRNPMIPSKKFKYKETEIAEDILIFAFNGEARLKYLRNVMLYLHRKNVNIVIVTNNGLCGSNLFGQYIKKFFGSIPYQLICSRRYDGDKATALANELINTPVQT